MSKTWFGLAALATAFILALSTPVQAEAKVTDTIGSIVSGDCDWECDECLRDAKETCGIWGVERYSCGGPGCVCTFSCKGILGLAELTTEA